MVRVLIMGRAGANWASRIAEIAGDELELDVARLPAEGIRRFEATPPDLILVIEQSNITRARTLIQAIQNRPLGRLLPIFLLSASPDAAADPEAFADELAIDTWFPLETSALELLAGISRALEIPIHDLQHGPLPPTTPGQSDGPRSEVEDHGDFLIEPLDEDEERGAGSKANPQAGDAASAGPRERDHAHEQAPRREGRPTATRTEEGAPAHEDESDVDFVPPPLPVARVERSSLFPVRAQQARVGEVSEESLRRKLKEARHEDYYTLLEVRRGSETAVLRESYQRLMARFDPKSLDFDLVRRFYEEIAEIRDALEDAWAVLGDPDLRQAYMIQSSGAPIG